MIHKSELFVIKKKKKLKIKQTPPKVIIKRWFITYKPVNVNQRTMTWFTNKNNSKTKHTNLYDKYVPTDKIC